MAARTLVESFSNGFLKPSECLDDFLADEWGVTDEYGCWYIAQWEGDMDDSPHAADLYYNGKHYIFSQSYSGEGLTGKSSWYESREAAIKAFKKLMSNFGH